MTEENTAPVEDMVFEDAAAPAVLLDENDELVGLGEVEQEEA